MSVSYIPEKVKTRLWGRAAGRCQYEGCNAPLWLDPVTKQEFNTSYIAHIVPDEPDGPRGDPVRSKVLKADISNLMLLCDTHHRLIDKEDVAAHAEARLLAMKLAHERRIETVTAIGPSRQGHIVLYGANIGDHASPVSYQRAAEAMLPDRFPAETNPISLGMVNSSLRDKTADFWRVESEHLRSMFTTFVTPRLNRCEISHLSVFALAPQPLLVLLGSLLCDLPAAEVYQLHREPPDWRWQPHPNGFDYQVPEPPPSNAAPALVFALSATVTDERITRALGGPAAIWRVSIPKPNNDFLKSKTQAQQFRQLVRPLMDRIKARHGENTLLRVFPTMPVALAVDFGRILMPKADLPLRIYDQNHQSGGFAPALDINRRPSESPLNLETPKNPRNYDNYNKAVR
jgi:hypothetical protein